MTTPRQLQTWVELQGTTSAVSRAAPTLATEGMDLGDIRGYRVSVYCANGQTLSGAGSLKAWVYNPDAGAAAKWTRNAALDVSLASASGVQMYGSQDVEVLLPRGRVLYAASGATFSGGGSGGVTVRIDGWSF